MVCICANVIETLVSYVSWQLSLANIPVLELNSNSISHGLHNI